MSESDAKARGWRARIDPWTATAGAVALAGGAAAYLKLARPRVLNFGATADEARRSLPGDNILPQVVLQTTRAVTIEASPGDIWPWLVQMGPRPRAGAYTYDWIERRLGIDIENTDLILPQFQHLESGDYLGINAKGHGLRVQEVDPERSLVLQWVPATSTWTFALCPDAPGRTRLLSRNRIPGSGPLFWLGMVLFMEAGSLVMERKMLLGIKERAERTARERGELAVAQPGAPSTMTAPWPEHLRDERTGRIVPNDSASRPRPSVA